MSPESRALLHRVFLTTASGCLENGFRLGCGTRMKTKAYCIDSINGFGMVLYDIAHFVRFCRSTIATPTKTFFSSIQVNAPRPMRMCTILQPKEMEESLFSKMSTVYMPLSVCKSEKVCFLGNITTSATTKTVLGNLSTVHLYISSKYNS